MQRGRNYDAAVSAIRACAMDMLENAQFIESELANVLLPPDLRTQTLEAVSALIGTKHDIISELFQFDELRESGAADAIPGESLARMIRWLGEDLSKLHVLVLALEAACVADPNVGAAYVLVTESAANIQRSYTRARELVS